MGRHFFHKEKCKFFRNKKVDKKLLNKMYFDVCSVLNQLFIHLPFLGEQKAPRPSGTNEEYLNLSKLMFAVAETTKASGKSQIDIVCEKTPLVVLKKGGQ